MYVIDHYFWNRFISCCRWTQVVEVHLEKLKKVVQKWYSNRIFYHYKLNQSHESVIYLYITSRQCSGSSRWRLGTSCLFIILSHGIRKKGFTWASCARGNAFVSARWVLRIFVLYTSIILFSKYFELFFISKNAGSTIARVISIVLETKNLFCVEIM